MHGKHDLEHVMYVVMHVVLAQQQQSVLDIDVLEPHIPCKHAPHVKPTSSIFTLSFQALLCKTRCAIASPTKLILNTILRST